MKWGLPISFNAAVFSKDVNGFLAICSKLFSHAPRFHFLWKEVISLCLHDFFHTHPSLRAYLTPSLTNRVTTP